MPSPTPATTAQANPISTSEKVTNAFGSRMSLSSTRDRTTSLGAGRSHNGVPETRTAISQTPTITAIRRSGETQPACRRSLARLMEASSPKSPSARSRVARSRMNSGDAIMDARPGARQRDGQLKCDAARSWRQDDHAVGEKDGFFDVVGDEQHRRPLLLPQSGEPRLQIRASQGIQRAEGFIEQDEVLARQDRAQKCRALAHAA